MATSPKNKSPKKGKPDFRRIFVCVMALAMVLALLLPIVAQIASGASATQAEIDALVIEQQESQARQEELEAELAIVEAEQSTAQEKKNILVSQLSAIQSELDSISAQITLYDQQIAEQEAQRLDYVAQEEAQYELFCQRVRAMEEGETTSYWACIFGASDFSDLLDRLTIVNDIIDYDQGVLDQLIATREAIETVKAELEVSQAAQEVKLAEQEEKKIAQAALVSEAQAVLDEISSDVDAVNELLDAENEAQALVDAEIAKKQAAIEAERYANNVTIDTGTGYLWPLPGYYTLTSMFGPRIHPITGAYNNHTGTDISASYGVSILAARGGQVITAEYHYSYGNYVVVDHGNGDSTLYAHMSSISVSEGDIIAQGTEVGKVGSTGSSTGNHLHFEVRIAGSRVNPEQFYTSLDFIRLY